MLIIEHVSYQRMNPILIIVLLFSLLIAVVFSQHAIYHISPTSESPCPYQHCHTLSEYATETNRYTNSNNLTLLFLPGEHVLNTSIDFQFLDNLSLLGDQSSLLDITSKITCQRMLAFVFLNISFVEIKALSFSKCGGQNSNQNITQVFILSNASTAVNVIPANTAQFLPNLYLDNCHFDSNYLPLMLKQSRVYVKDNVFSGNKGSFGGAIAAYSSSVVLLGQNMFLSNEALVGGGVLAINNSLLFNGSTVFINNTAANLSITGFFDSSDHMQEFLQYGGGGITLLDSIMLQNRGQLNFTRNHAGNGGGAISSHKSHIGLDSFAIFDHNSAAGSGGAVRIGTGTWSSAEISFVGNSAETGGAIYAVDSELTLSKHLSNNVQVPSYPWECTSGHTCCQTVFKGNSSTNSGGAIMIKESFIMVSSDRAIKLMNGNMTRICFMDNEASEDGGGILLYRFSTLSITGRGVYISNTAGGSGGAIIATRSSSIVLHGKNNFTDNQARYGGGLAVTGLSTLSILGNVTYINNTALDGSGGAISASLTDSFTLDGNHIFVGNNADKGGGITVEHRSAAFFSGVISFIGNQASFYGGGIYFWSSTSTILGNWSFINNTARVSGGGILLDSSNVSIVTLAVTYINNTAGVFGGAVMLGSHSTLNVTGITYFLANVANFDGGGIFLHLSTLSSTGIHTFTNNVARYTGGGISGEDSIIALDGTATMVNNSAGTSGGALALNDCDLRISNWLLNASDGGFDISRNRANYLGGTVYATGSHLDLSGSTKFVNNVASSGGGIYAVSSDITLKGSHTFKENTASYGGGLDYEDYFPTHFIYVSFNASVTFEGNYAKMQGGAIFIHDAADNYCNPGEISPTRACFVNFHTIPSDLPLVRVPLESQQDIFQCVGHMVFEGNVAAAGGSSLYGGGLHNCRVDLSHNYSCDDIISGCSNHTCYISGVEAIATLSATSVKQLTDNPFNIMSDNFQVCFCEPENLLANCQQRSSNYTSYPGEILLIPVDVFGNNAESILSSVIHAKFIESKGVWLDSLQDAQSINTSCTVLKFTMHSSGAKAAQLELSVEGPCQYPGLSLYINVKFHACPPGFAAPFGSCVCEKRLHKYTNSCDIITRAITRNGDFWIGLDRHSHGLILHPHCSFDYCTSETVSFTLNSTDLQCTHGRSGILCGACKSGFSLKFGSSQCSSCSNVFLLLLIPLAIAGFLLVVFLFICKVTVSAGTTSGLIFYANVITVNKTVFFAKGETNILTVFIAWLNLDLGFETCFIDGMDMYTRTWLQFVFPLYLWGLVGIIALVSHRSTFIARIIGPTNPVSVLATLFLLSYTKLLRTIIATLSFTTLDYPDDKSVTVWVYDGNIEYFKGKHIPLVLTGLLAFLLLFLPYTLLLLFGQWVEARSNHKLLSWVNKPTIKHFLDAYYGPYKNQHRYWTGLLLLLRFVLFVISAVVDINSPRDPSINFLVLDIACAGLVILVWNIGNMYKRWVNNFLESSFILNLTILALASYHVKVDGGNQTAVVYTSVSIAFVTFLAIISFHVVERLRDSRTWRVIISSKLQSLKQTFTHHRESDNNPPQTFMVPIAPSRPVPTTFVELREPLLESKN